MSNLENVAKGHFSFFLASHGSKPNIFSLDDPPSLLSLLPRGEYEFVKGDKSDPVSLPYPDAFFDGIASVGVLEHVREFGGNEDASLREIFRVLPTSFRNIKNLKGLVDYSLIFSLERMLGHLCAIWRAPKEGEAGNRLLVAVSKKLRKYGKI